MADVFVNPTYSDNYPTTNLEALACGTPVITYRTGGSPEAITDVENVKMVKDGIECYPTGMVIEQGNVTALANAIMQMKDTPPLISRLPQACRRTLRQRQML